MAISPQPVETSTELAGKLRLGYPILRDEGNAIADAFGLRHGFPDDLREVYAGFGLDLSDSNWTLPMPARYIIDTAGVIRYARVHPDYTRRPEPTETVAALASLG